MDNDLLLHRARDCSQQIVAFILAKHVSAHLLDVQCDENGVWWARIMVGEQDGKQQWEGADGRMVYARAYEVSFDPTIESPILFLVNPASRIIERFESEMHEPPDKA